VTKKTVKVVKRRKKREDGLLGEDDRQETVSPTSPEQKPSLQRQFVVGGPPDEPDQLGKEEPSSEDTYVCMFIFTSILILIFFRIKMSNK